MTYSKNHCFLAICFLLSSLSAYGNNGKVAYAFSMDPITVDGDLADWPNHLPYYPIKTFLFGHEIKGEADIQAKLRVGFNLQTQMLYVGVEVLDDNTVSDTSPEREWNTHDAHNFYIDPDHNLRGSMAISHLMSPDYYRIAEKRPQDYWDPQVRNATWDDVKVEIKHKGNKTVYEWSYFMGERLQVGRTIGFDYEVIDKDKGEDGFPSVLAFGPNGGKGFNATSVSDLVLVEKETDLGMCSGKVAWATEDYDQKLSRLILRSADNPSNWTHIEVDSLGKYEVKLPPGNYELQSPFLVYYLDQENQVRIDNSQSVSGTIRSGQRTSFPTWNIQTLDRPTIGEKGVLANFDQSKIEDLDRFMETFMKYYNVPGVSLALVKDAELAYHNTYGYRNYYAKEPVEAETLFDAASVTKTVFAFAVNRLAEKGDFDLDKPLHTYLPFEAIAKDDRYKLMTGRHVLTHVSGLPNWGQELREEPGTKFGYSGEGFEYLKRAVVKATGRDVEEIIQTEVLDPLEIPHTYFSRKPEMAKYVSHGHYSNFPTLVDIPAQPMMAYSMHTEAKAFSQFMIALLKREGLNASTFEEFFRPQTKVPEYSVTKAIKWEEHFGLGILTIDTPYGKAYGHGGNNGDFRCQYEIFDEGKMGFVIFTNSNHGHLLVMALREYLITGEVEYASNE